MWKRWDTTRSKAMAAVNEGASGKRVKKNPELESSFASKKYSGAGVSSYGKKSSDVRSFQYDQKYKAQPFQSRSFLGIKNPWFGGKVYRADDASLWTRNSIGNSDRKFDVKSAQTKKAMMADKTVSVSGPVVETKAYEGNGAAPGSVSKITDKITKEMTLAEVRELLNKDR